MNAHMIDPTLPLIDLHRHLDVNVRPETILDLGRQHNLPLPAQDLEGLRTHVNVQMAMQVDQGQRRVNHMRVHPCSPFLISPQFRSHKGFLTQAGRV